MPTFHVALLKEVWMKASVTVDATTREEAESVAITLGETDESIEWRYYETPSIDAIDVEEAVAQP